MGLDAERLKIIKYPECWCVVSRNDLGEWAPLWEPTFNEKEGFSALDDARKNLSLGTTDFALAHYQFNGLQDEKETR